MHYFVFCQIKIDENVKRSRTAAVMLTIMETVFIFCSTSFFFLFFSPNDIPGTHLPTTTENSICG